MNATSIDTLTGTKNVVVTSVAIIDAPAGSTASSAYGSDVSAPGTGCPTAGCSIAVCSIDPAADDISLPTASIPDWKLFSASCTAACTSVPTVDMCCSTLAAASFICACNFFSSSSSISRLTSALTSLT